MQFEIASRKGRTLRGISVQFVDHLTLKQEVITIGMMHLESTSGLVLKQKMEECRAEYGLSITQVYSYTTDNGKNVLKATRDLLRESEQFIIDENCEYDDYEDEPASKEADHDHDWDEALIRCAANTVQLAMNDMLKHMHNKLKNIRGQVKVAREQLKKRKMNIPPLITRYTYVLFQ